MGESMYMNSLVRNTLVRRAVGQYRVETISYGRSYRETPRFYANEPERIFRPRFLARRPREARDFESVWLFRIESCYGGTVDDKAVARTTPRARGDAARYLCVVFRSGTVRIEMKSQRKKPHRQLNWYARGTQWYSYAGLVRFTDGIRARRRAGRSGGRTRNATWCRRYGAKAPSPLFSASPISFIFRCAPISFSPLFASPLNEGVPKQKSMNNRRHSPLCSPYTPFPGPLIRCARRFVSPSICRSPNGHGTSNRLPWSVTYWWFTPMGDRAPGFGERKRPPTPFFPTGNCDVETPPLRERFEKFLTTSIYIDANIGGGWGGMLFSAWRRMTHFLCKVLGHVIFHYIRRSPTVEYREKKCLVSKWFQNPKLKNIKN